MKIPRNVSANTLIKLLRKQGYVETRQTGSHIRLTTQNHGQHHVTIPNHDPIKIGTLSAILNDVSEHLKMKKEELLKML